METYDRLVTTTDGRVFRVTCKEVKKHVERNGYLRCRDGNGNRHLVHRLVATQHIPNPDGKPQINHKNRDRKDNRVDNLEWVTAQENQEHAIAKEWRFISPTGDPVSFLNLSKFCRENNLNQGHMWSVHKGRIRHCKGWTRQETH